MYLKLIKNDLKKSKLINATILCFIYLAALLSTLSAILTVDLSSSIDHMMTKAKTPHFVQMHSGPVDTIRLQNFIDTQETIEDFQILKLLNIEGSEIIIGENSLASSVQDNGLCVQSQNFDFLLDLDGEIIHPADGQIYVPLYYMKSNQAKIGDTVNIHGVPFVVSGFFRDSQMNADIVSSKRFLVNEKAFEQLRDFGKVESLIEFRLDDSANIADFESAYLQANLESNGPPAITYPLIRLANAISDGLMIAVLMLVCFFVIAVNFLCIRFALLAKIEEDYQEIGVLKAIGLKVSDIKSIYLAKYGAIALIACVLGFISALFLQIPLTKNIRLTMGQGDQKFLATVLGMFASAIIFLVIVLYVSSILRRFKKISPAQAIRFGGPQEKTKLVRTFQLHKFSLFSPTILLGIKDVLSRKKLYSTMLFVLVIASFLMIVPQNIYSTLSSRNFMTYMGVGECDLRMDIQQTDNILAKNAQISDYLSQDTDVEAYTLLNSYMFDVQTEDDQLHKLKIELGNHSAFPIQYVVGHLPQAENEIALSSLVADDLEKQVGDSLTLLSDGKENQLIVCGIYSDVTNGGKTAKAVFTSNRQDVLWSVIPIKFADSTVTAEKNLEYSKNFSYAKISDIDEYIQQIFGSTIIAVKKVSIASAIATGLLAFLITLLFIKMLLAKDRHQIPILKSLGFRSKDIRHQYIATATMILMLGIFMGTALANTLGEWIGTGLISTFGVRSLNFETNPLLAYILSPALIAICVYIATKIGLLGISELKISDYIKE